MNMKSPVIDMTALAEEVRRISHTMRSALSVLKVGAQMASTRPEDVADIASAMCIKADEIDRHCTRLTEISEMLKVGATD